MQQPPLIPVFIAGKSYEFSGDSDDFFYRNIKSFADGNAKLVDYAVGHLQPDAICLDIGANIGLTAAALTGSHSRRSIFAFEPSPVNLRYLHENIERNELINVQVINYAVGAQDGFVNFFLPQCGANSTVLRSATLPTGDNYTRVKLCTIDNWIKSQSFHKLDFMKIDVEGFEPEVLVGAANTIVKHRPMIYMEFNSITTIFEGRINPLILAEVIWELFDVFTMHEGQMVPVEAAREFVFKNIMERGCIDDLLMMVKPNVTPPQIVAMMPTTAATAAA